MNTIGKIFKVQTFGESHGKAIGCVIDGCPANLEIDINDVQKELNRRKPGQSIVSTKRSEEDKVEIISGIFEGKTLGTPISMIIYNKDTLPEDYNELRDKIRPGHADFTWREKFGHIDWRGGGRSSARETAARVAAGAVAKKLLSKYGVNIFSHTFEIGGIRSKVSAYGSFNFDKIRNYKKSIESNPVRAIDGSDEMVERIIKARENQDSVGGIIESIVTGMPKGIGEPTFDKLNARLGYYLLSIPASRGIEFGRGFECSRILGSENNDEFFVERGKIKMKTNNAGGILGGISTGEPVILRLAFKPTSSIGMEQNTVDIRKMEGTKLTISGRHDPCIVPRAVPIVDAMVALCIADFMMIQGLIGRVIK